ncbi:MULTISPECIES: hypothetical protein [unclassified Acidovorax]|nr:MULTISPECIES: hypothetical protein [unclassified Acidovorax]
MSTLRYRLSAYSGRTGISARFTHLAHLARFTHLAHLARFTHRTHPARSC